MQYKQMYGTGREAAFLLEMNQNRPTSWQTFSGLKGTAVIRLLLRVGAIGIVVRWRCFVLGGVSQKKTA